MKKKTKNYRVKFQEKLQLENSEQFLQHQGHLYRVAIWGYDSFRILDMTEAGRRGKKCLELTVNSHAAPSCAIWNDLLGDHTQALLEATTAQVFPPKLSRSYFQVYLGAVESIRVMPLDLSIIKPLTAIPKKWTIPHVIKALVNGQYKNLKKTIISPTTMPGTMPAALERVQLVMPLDLLKKS